MRQHDNQACALRTHGLAALVSILAFALAAFVAPRGPDELTLELALTFVAMPLLCGSWLARWEAHASRRWWAKREQSARTNRKDGKVARATQPAASPAHSEPERPPTVSGIRARRRHHAAA